MLLQFWEKFPVAGKKQPKYAVKTDILKRIFYLSANLRKNSRLSPPNSNVGCALHTIPEASRPARQVGYV
jgi:hypothetical protein